MDGTTELTRVGPLTLTLRASAGALKLPMCNTELY